MLRPAVSPGRQARPDGGRTGGRFNLASCALEIDQFAEAVQVVDDALAMAAERGDRAWERMLLAQSVAPLVVLGRWERAEPSPLCCSRARTTSRQRQ